MHFGLRPGLFVFFRGNIHLWGRTQRRDRACFAKSIKLGRRFEPRGQMSATVRAESTLRLDTGSRVPPSSRAIADLSAKSRNANFRARGVPAGSKSCSKRTAAPWFHSSPGFIGKHAFRTRLETTLVLAKQNELLSLTQRIHLRTSFCTNKIHATVDIAEGRYPLLSCDLA